ncbi:MAG: hypothetical protein Q7K57_26435, partial [Burkholderiaceae bacterium]|nr:hypothetical protein [Burkholderiaceae bacterium]
AWLVRKPMVRKVDAQEIACTQNAGSLVRVRWYAGTQARYAGNGRLQGIHGAVASKKPIRAGWYKWAVRGKQALSINREEIDENLCMSKLTASQRGYTQRRVQIWEAIERRLVTLKHETVSVRDILPLR